MCACGVRELTAFTRPVGGLGEWGRCTVGMLHFFWLARAAGASERVCEE